MLKCPLMAIINLNEDHMRRNELTRNRPLASLPIAGRYRLIDFILSDITGASIYNVGIFAQRKIRSLNDHLGDGSTWDLDRLIDGMYIFSNNYEVDEKQLHGDLSNIFENIDFIERSPQDYILITNPYYIYTVDFTEVYDAHISSGCDITAMFKTVDNANVDFYNVPVYNINNDRISSVGRNMCSSNVKNISMNTFIMKKEKFIELVYSAVETGEFTYLEDMINSYILKSNCNLYRFNGYLKAITDIKSYRDFNKEILNKEVADDIFKNPVVRIYTKTKDEAPTYFDVSSDVKNSIIASGCMIEGVVKNSVISRKVKIGKGSVVENSILLQNTVVEDAVYINNVIADKNAVITANKKLIGDINMPIIIKKGDRI